MSDWTKTDRAIARLFAYLDYARPDAPRNAQDPYQVDVTDGGSYSFKDLRTIQAELVVLREAAKSAAISLHYHAARETNPLIRAESAEILDKIYDAMGAPDSWRFKP